MTHDRCCPLDDGEGIDCAVCDAIVRARKEELAKFNLTWRQNIRPIELRNYERGYRDAANGRRFTP